MKKNALLLLFLAVAFLSTTESHSQIGHSDRSPFWSRVYWGGSLGLSFGNDFFSGTLAPSAIYRVDERVGMGLGLNISYVDDRDLYTSWVYGGSVIGLYDPIPGLQLSMEFELLRVTRDFNQDILLNPDENYLYPGLFLGLGYSAGNVTVGIRVDVLYDDTRSIYSSAFVPFFRAYF